MTPVELFSLLAIVFCVGFAVVVAVCVVVLLVANRLAGEFDAELVPPDPDHPPP